MTWLKQLPITIEQNSIGRIHRPIQLNPHKIQQTIRNEPHNQKRGSENPNKSVMLPHTTKSQTNTIPSPERRKQRTKSTNKVRTPRKTRNKRRRLFCITRSIYREER